MLRPLTAPLALALALILPACGGAPAAAKPEPAKTEPVKTAPAPVAQATGPILDHEVETLDGTKQKLSDYRGKAVLLVNVASECGYTPQYAQLQELYGRYKDRGLVVLGFPSNDFGGQETGSNEDNAAFCVNQNAIDFPRFAKTRLKDNALYAELARATGAAPRWNFHKYLVDRGGKPVESFDTRVEPDDAKLIAAIEKLL